MGNRHGGLSCGGEPSIRRTKNRSQSKDERNNLQYFFGLITGLSYWLWALCFLSLKIRSILTRCENNLLLSNKQIREQKTVFETLYQKSADGVWLLRRRVFIDCNEAIVKMFGGNDKSQLINISPKDIAPEFQPDGENSYEKALKMNAKAVENGVHKFEWRAKKIDGTLFGLVCHHHDSDAR